MSLINDMLRDLDKRKSTYPRHSGETDGARITPVLTADNSAAAHGWLWLIVVVGLLLLGVFLWQLYGHFEQRLEQRLDAIEAPLVTIPQPSAAEQVSQSDVQHGVTAAFAQILAVDVQAVAQGARIEISLSAPVSHRVLRNGQQLIIDLPATRLVQALPNLTDHPLISAADVLTHAGGTQLEVDVTRPISVQTSLLTQQGSQQPLLVVELIVVAEELAILKGASPINRGAVDAEKPIAAGNKTTENADAGSEAGGEIAPSFEKTTRQLSLIERDQQNNRLALQEMRAGQIQAAKQRLSALLNDYAQAHESRTTLVAMLLSQGAAGEAAKLLDVGLRLAPEQLAFIKLKARLLLSQQQAASALTLLNAQSKQAGSDPEFLSLLATASQRDGQHSRAVTLYQQLLKQNNQQPQWRIGQAISLEALSQKAEALQAYLQARRIPGISPALKAYAENRINQLN